MLSILSQPALGLVVETTNPIKPAVQVKKSQAIPFLENPPHLDGSMAGDHVSCCPRQRCCSNQLVPKSRAPRLAPLAVPSEIILCILVSGVRPVWPRRCLQPQVYARGALRMQDLCMDMNPHGHVGVSVVS